MKTYSPKKEDIKRQWYLVDVKGKTLGRAATKIANILRGKNKTIFSPHLDCGDYVIVINAKDISLSGNKKTQKMYYHHTRYPGGLKQINADRLLTLNPELVIQKAITGMVPNNRLKKSIMKKLKVFSGSEHSHTAQNPKPIEI